MTYCLDSVVRKMGCRKHALFYGGAGLNTDVPSTADATTDLAGYAHNISPPQV